jgi:hypothetical protein
MSIQGLQSFPVSPVVFRVYGELMIGRIDPVTTEILGPGWFESTEWKEEPTPMPTEFNVPFAESHMLTIEVRPFSKVNRLWY